ncbi:MAG TPA: fused MFS/spermidine synthase [Terracidiphilus sp.]|nr:fused MFS/spermidine synthase [Terracidiphilus sp.]
MNQSRLLFGSAVFLGAFLLFLVEPLAARQLLPALGGSAAVWITCLVFFQTALLIAYLYAHALARSGRSIPHVALLFVALASTAAWVAGNSTPMLGANHPIAAVFLSLTGWIGFPFLALGATSPLLQVWWTRIEGTPVPWRLYALSNLASLLALAAYPTLIEPHWALDEQRGLWAYGFLVFVLISSVVAWQVRLAPPAQPAAAPAEAPETLPLRSKLLWLLLPMGAAMQLCAVTAYLTANIAAIPLLWVLPLGVYLLTLIVAFQFPRLGRSPIVPRLLIVFLAGLAYMLTQTESALPMRIAIGFFLVELFLAGLYLHAEACALRPARTAHATLFYLLFAAGGALGSFLIGIAAPLLFRYNYDLAITFCVTALLALAAAWPTGWNNRLIWAASSATLAVLVCWLVVASQRQTIAAVRNFYASLRVKESHSYPGATIRILSNGSIQHGTQIFGTDALRRTPTTYYAEDSGVGLALRFCCGSRPRRIGVIGLGAGTLAAYGRPGDQIRFYEINPAVEPIARNVFTYLRESPAAITVVPGDARLSLARELAQGRSPQFDVLVVDAFSGDAIPLHLLTTQALALYRRCLAPGGILAFHISNQHVDLDPPIALLAQNAGLTARRVFSVPNSERGEFGATWMLLTDNAAFLQQPEVAPSLHTPGALPGLRLWTDDYSALLPVLRW